MANLIYSTISSPLLERGEIVRSDKHPCAQLTFFGYNQNIKASVLRRTDPGAHLSSLHYNQKQITERPDPCVLEVYTNKQVQGKKVFFLLAS